MKPGKEPFTLKQLRKYMEQKGVARQYWPEHIEFADEFLRTPSGKIQKFKLREMIAKKVEG